MEISVYDSTTGNLTDTKVRKGTSSGGTTYWKSKYVYGSGGLTTYNGSTVYRVTEAKTYPSDTATEAASDLRTTTYDYAYYKADGTVTTTASLGTHAVAFIKTTYPSVSTGNNGSGTAPVSYVHYRKAEFTVSSVTYSVYYQDWTKHQDGMLDYRQQYYANDQTKFALQDVLTNSTTHKVSGETEDDGTTDLQAPSDPWGGQWDTSTTLTGAGKNRKTSYTYDNYGRTLTITSPDSIKTQMAYMSQQSTSGSLVTTTTEVTLTARHMSGGGTYNYVPLEINVQDLAGRTKISAAGIPTTGTGGDITNDWTVATSTLDSAFAGTLTRRMEYNYNDSGKLTSTVAWTDADDTNDDKYTTSYAYYGSSDATPGLLKSVTSPDGTITKTLYNELGRAKEVKVGTDDGSPGNMVTVSKTFFDGDTSGTLVSGGAGNVTEQRVYYGASTYYATRTKYDFQRMTESIGPDNIGTKYTYTDSNGKSIVETYYDSGQGNFVLDSGELRGKSESYIDERGQTYKTVVYDVSSSGTAGNTMTTLSWYDSMGRTIKTKDANALFRKMQYNSVGETIGQFVSYDSGEGDTEYTKADDVASDTVIEQTVNTYDATTGNLLLTTSYQRVSGSSKTGDLSDTWAAADSRHTYVAYWYDSPLNRPEYVGDYGTNGGSALTRPGTAPSSSDTVHVSRTEYDTYGRAYQTTNAKGIVTKQSFNDLDKLTETVEASTGSAVTETDTVNNRTTQITYDSSGRQSQLVAKNPKGSGNGIESQTTKYVYGTATGGITPDIYRNDILRAVIYPDSDDTTALGNGTDSTYDRVEYTYDVMGRKKTSKDQRGVEHTYEYYDANSPYVTSPSPAGDGSLKGRLKADRITSLGSSGVVDDHVRRILFGYDGRGRVVLITSSSTDSGGTVRNEVKFTYADSSWGQLTKIEQNNTGAVGGGTPAIDYAYADGNVSGAAKYVRRTSTTYPGPGTRKVVYHNYPSSGDGAMLSRLDNFADDSSGTTKYAQYTYLGAGAIAKVQHPAVTNNLVLNYDPSNNGTFTALNQFGQVVDQNWTVNSSTIDQYAYGYDRNANRNYRENTQSTTKSEYYTYDNLDRVSHADRGTLNAGKTAITTLAFAQDWALDQLGNWATFKTDNDGNGNYNSTGDLNHSRAHNAANETGIITTTYGSTWINPVHDAAGNMTEMPIPGTETAKHKAVYDAWNRLVQIKNNSDAVIATYRFNGLNHRIRKEMGSASNENGVEYDYYYNESWQVLEEVKKPSGGSAATYAQYVWDIRYIDAPAVRFRDSDANGSLDETLYYCNDANMNVTALVNASGTVQERYSYDSYGKVNIWDGSWGTRASSSYDNQILFGGYRFDPETGLYHVRNRMYHPMLGRWSQRDPIGYEDGMHVYQYVSAKPTIATDPRGISKFIFVFEGLYNYRHTDLDEVISGKRPRYGARALNMVYQTAAEHGLGKDVKVTHFDNRSGRDVRGMAMDTARAQGLAKPTTEGGNCYHTLVVVGHSFGGDAAYEFAYRLNHEGLDGSKVKANLIFTIDPRERERFLGGPFPGTGWWTKDFGDIPQDGFYQRQKEWKGKPTGRNTELKGEGLDHNTIASHGLVIETFGKWMQQIHSIRHSLDSLETFDP